MEAELVGLTHDYHGSDWRPPIDDLDEFFTSLHDYHAKGGVGGLVVDRLCQLTVYGFVASLVGTAAFALDWSVFSADGPSDLVDYTRRPSGFLFSAFVATCSAWGAYSLWAAVREVPGWLRARKFSREISKMTPSDPWPTVVARMEELQNTRGYKILVGKDLLTPLDVTARVLRKENYLVALVDSGILGERLTGPEIALARACIVDGLFPKERWCVHVSEARLSDRSRLFAFFSLVLLPCALVVYSGRLLCEAAQVAAAPSGTVSWRFFRPDVRWTMRNYNEYPEEVDRRLQRATTMARRYLSMIRRPVFARIVGVLRLVTASLWGCISIAALAREDALVGIYVADRELLWWLAFFTGAFALCTAASADRSLATCAQQDELLDEIQRELRYFSREGFDSHAVASARLHQIYVAFPALWVRDLYSIARAPLTLLSWSSKAGVICGELTRVTEFGTMAGDVCGHGTGEGSSGKQEQSRVHFHDMYSSCRT